MEEDEDFIKGYPLWAACALQKKAMTVEELEQRIIADKKSGDIKWLDKIFPIYMSAALSPLGYAITGDQYDADFKAAKMLISHGASCTKRCYEGGGFSSGEKAAPLGYALGRIYYWTHVTKSESSPMLNTKRVIRLLASKVSVRKLILIPPALGLHNPVKFCRLQLPDVLPYLLRCTSVDLCQKTVWFCLFFLHKHLNFPRPIAKMVAEYVWASRDEEEVWKATVEGKDKCILQ
jgi:hypothetical protein